MFAFYNIHGIFSQVKTFIFSELKTRYTDFRG